MEKKGPSGEITDEAWDQKITWNLVKKMEECCKGWGQSIYFGSQCPPGHCFGRCLCNSPIRGNGYEAVAIVPSRRRSALVCA